MRGDVVPRALWPAAVTATGVATRLVPTLMLSLDFWLRAPLVLITFCTLVVACHQRWRANKLSSNAAKHGRVASGRHNSPAFRISNALTIACALFLVAASVIILAAADPNNPDKVLGLGVCVHVFG